MKDKNKNHGEYRIADNNRHYLYTKEFCPAINTNNYISKFNSKKEVQNHMKKIKWAKNLKVVKVA